MKLAILTPIHGRVGDKVIQQVQNYQRWCQDVTLKFYFHPSLESTNQLTADVIHFAKKYSADTLFCPLSAATSFKTCLNAMLELDELMALDNFEPDYIYWHTDSDLLIAEGLSTEIAKFDLGIDIINFPLSTRAEWPHSRLMWADIRASRFVERFLDGDTNMIKIGRTEGSFFRRPVWDAIISVVRTYFQDSYFDNVEHHWCAEEILIPTISNHPYISDKYGGRRENLVFVKRPDQQLDRTSDDHVIEIADILELRSQGVFYAAKWFSNNLNDPARRFVAGA